MNLCSECHERPIYNKLNQLCSYCYNKKRALCELKKIKWRKGEDKEKRLERSYGRKAVDFVRNIKKDPVNFTLTGLGKLLGISREMARQMFNSLSDKPYKAIKQEYQRRKIK